MLSGMRPTGKLHLGNYMGALYNWVRLQHEYECYFFIADWHALTSDYADTSQVRQNTREVALDFLAAGLDPEECAIFVQSHVKPHSELPSVARDDHSTGLAGARAHLQGAAGESDDQGPEHLWLPRISA